MIMQAISVAERPSIREIEVRRRVIPDSQREIELGLLTACRDRHCALGLAIALADRGVSLDLVGGDEIDSPELHTTPNLRFLNFRDDHGSKASFAKRLSKLLVYYGKLIRYAARTKPRVLHILWNGKFEFFDRTLLMLYYKLCGKKVVLTAHNVNGARRDGKDSLLNRVTLRMQYSLCDHVFVHTQKMKEELCEGFRVPGDAVTVIPYPMNYALHDTELTSAEAKLRLGLGDEERTILFFGKIRPYKGIEHLVAAFKLLSAPRKGNYRLILAGEPTKDSEEYLHEIQHFVEQEFHPQQVILRIQFIPDEERWNCISKRPTCWSFRTRRSSRTASCFGVLTVLGRWSRRTSDRSGRTSSRGCTGFLCMPGDPADMARSRRRDISQAICSRT